MTLQNPGFEGDWWRKTHTGVEYGEIFVPVGWTAWWKEGLPVPHDPANTNGYGRPEMQVINKEPPFLDPPRIQEGNRALKFFTFYRIHEAGLYQTIDVTPGALYNLSLYAHAWSSQDDNPHTSEGAPGAFFALEGEEGLTDDQRNFTFCVGVDLTGGTNPWAATVQWGMGAHIYNAYSARVPALGFVAKGTQATVFLRSSVLWPFKHCDAYLDAVVLTENTTPEPECYGEPRVQYVRRYNVYPTWATAERRAEIAAICAAKQETCGPSYDDAGLGALEDKTAVLWDIPAELRQDFIDFYNGPPPNGFYPGTKVEFAGDSPEPPEPLRLTYPCTHLPADITQPFIWPGTHGGIDLRCSWAAWGDNAVCALDGIVMNDPRVYHSTFGYYVLTSCQHDGNKYDLRYAHLVNPPAVSQGATVTRGQVLGKCDNTGTSTGDHLHFSVYSYKDGDYIDPEPLIDWPDDPTPPPPVSPIRPAGTRGNIILHHMPTGPEGVTEFLSTIRPPAHLVVAGGAGELQQARAASPASLLALRRVEDDLPLDNPQAAYAFVDRYLQQLQGTFDLTDFSKPPIYIASINERGYECGNHAGIQQGVAWDIGFMDAVEATGLNIRAIVYKAAVGNPHTTPDDLSLLLPMVERAVRGKHLLGKHSYYASVPNDPTFYQQSWDWYGGRFAQDDAYFVSQGLKPYWMFAEGGACMATLNTNGSVSLSPGDGWKSCGDIERYARELAWANQWYTNWNNTHEGRLLGCALFTTGGWGWDKFQLQGGDLAVVTAALNGAL